MRRRAKSAKHGTTEDSVDALEEALRQVGADILQEPVPEALRRVLRGKREHSESNPDTATDDPSQRTRRR